MQFAFPAKLKDKVNGTNIKDIYKRFKSGEKLYDLAKEHNVDVGLLCDLVAKNLMEENLKSSYKSCIIYIL